MMYKDSIDQVRCRQPKFPSAASFILWSLLCASRTSASMKPIFTVATLLSACVQEASSQGIVGTGVGILNLDDTQGTVGNAYSYWHTFPNGTIDLTRRDVSPTTSPKLIPMTGMRTSAIIEPSRSVFCIIDMQNYFLHPALAPTSEDGRAAVDPTIQLAKSFRHHGIKNAWVNWGLNDFDLLMLPPSVKTGFSNNETMGIYEYKGKTIDAGPRLRAGSWNVEPYGKLKGVVERGIQMGTDLLFNKNRLSGLWGATTPFGTWLQQNEITTIFIGGVDADQCVRTTFMDAYFKGYDVIYVDDLAATRNGEAAYENTRFTANYTSFIADSRDIITALKS